jgi:hypothetical protein
MAFDWGGAGTGAGFGALAGTAIMPGIGTAIGAVGGGLIGGMAGDVTEGNWDRRFDKADASYVAQNDNIGDLKEWSEGRGPSAAQDLLERNRSDVSQRSLAYAKAGAGGNPALAAQMANQQQWHGNADAGLQSATLRAQEQQNAMAAYTQALQTRRQQDLDQAKAQMEGDLKDADAKSGMIGSIMGGVGGLLG